MIELENVTASLLKSRRKVVKGKLKNIYDRGKVKNIMMIKRNTCQL